VLTSLVTISQQTQTTIIVVAPQPRPVGNAQEESSATHATQDTLETLQRSYAAWQIIMRNGCLTGSGQAC